MQAFRHVSSALFFTNGPDGGGYSNIYFGIGEMVKFPAPSTRPCRKIFLDFLGMVKFAVSDLGA